MSGDTSPRLESPVTLDSAYTCLERIGVHVAFTSRGEPVVTACVPETLRDAKAALILEHLASQFGIGISNLGLNVNRSTNQCSLTFYCGINDFAVFQQAAKLLQARQSELQPQQPERVYLGPLEPQNRNRTPD